MLYWHSVIQFKTNNKSINKQKTEKLKPLLIRLLCSPSTGEVRLCGDDVCHPNARCVFNSDIGRPMCECNSGYYGDGKNCSTLGLFPAFRFVHITEKIWLVESPGRLLCDLIMTMNYGACVYLFVWIVWLFLQPLSVTRPRRFVILTRSVSTTTPSSGIGVSVGRDSAGTDWSARPTGTSVTVVMMTPLVSSMLTPLLMFVSASQDSQAMADTVLRSVRRSLSSVTLQI